MTINTVTLVVRDAADAWAEYLGTKVKFYDMDGTNKDVKKYVGNKFTPIVETTGSPSYEPPSFHPDKDVVLTTSFNNKGDGIGRIVHDFAQTETDSFAFSFTQGVALSVSHSASVEVSGTLLGIGAKGTATTTLTAEMSLSSTQTVNRSEQTTLRAGVTYEVPPHKKATLTYTISHKRYDMRFTAPTTLTNEVAVWFDKKVDFNDPKHGNNKHHLWFIGIGTLLTKSTRPNIRITNRSHVDFIAEGVIRADYFLGGDAEATTTGDADPNAPQGLGPVRRLVKMDGEQLTAAPARSEEPVAA